jgi:molecular chaperone HtpG
VDLSKLAPEAEPQGEGADLTALLPLLRAALKEEVSGVEDTAQLVDSAVVLTAQPGAPDLQMQRMLRRAGRAFGPDRAVLRLNPRHALVRRLAERAAAGEDITEMAGLLLDLARVQDGDTPRDPAAFSRRVAAALAAEG